MIWNIKIKILCKIIVSCEGSMDNNFFMERADRWYSNVFSVKGMTSLFLNHIKSIVIIGLVVGVILLTLTRNITIIIVGIVASFVVIAVVLEIIFANNRNKKELPKCTYGLNILELCDNSEDKQEVYNYINNTIKNNEINFRYNIFNKNINKPNYENNEIILLPRYLLDCNDLFVKVSHVEEVYWVVVEYCTLVFPSTAIMRNNTTKQIEVEENYTYATPIQSYAVCIYYSNKKTGILCETIKEAKNVASEINKYFPNYIGESTKELQEMFEKNHAGFIKIYEQKKLEYEIEHKKTEC